MTLTEIHALLREALDTVLSLRGHLQGTSRDTALTALTERHAEVHEAYKAVRGAAQGIAEGILSLRGEWPDTPLRLDTLLTIAEALILLRKAELLVGRDIGEDSPKH
jgi:hypothetical protein